MASLAILVMHSSRWDNDNCYVDYTIEGVISKESSSYKELYNVIAMQLGVDTNVIKLKIEYKVKESKMSMLIHNDMGVRGPYNGTFVAASTMVRAAWSWFFVQLREAYGERSNMCEVSDRNESIIKAVIKVYKNVPHYAYMWYFWCNVEKKFRKASKELSPVFYTMAKTWSKVEFDRLMDIVEKVDVGVKEYLELAGYDNWSRCHAETHRGWAMTSNIAESINAALVSARELPIFNFLEEVRLMFGRWNHDNKHEAACTFTTLIGKFQKILIENEAMSTRMGNKTFSCEKFRYEEIPCEHAWAVLKRKSLVADGYCSDLYKPKTVLKIYKIPIYPLSDVAEWVIPEYIMYDEVRSPNFKRPPGRPKNKPRSKTKRELLGLKGKHTCSTCGVAGHNSR
ncbi:hypothetical protein H5410_047915 [Solanum commersonii]|uniref:SWIM-type domain-containing protein n=1 Tax=Solanum commersonii TaxID=4109 RepID=A0A9J5XGJ2_SOLCO|nr:hypothetical protein H5410_047915 [Solanum commersonii]